MTATTRKRYKYVGLPEDVMEWTREKLGLEPSCVSHIRIDIGPDCAATITVDLFARTGDIESLPLGDLESVEDAA